MTAAAHDGSVALAEQVRAALAENADPARAAQERRYLKSDLEHLGVSLPVMRALVRAVSREHLDMTRDELADLVRVLWDWPVHECRSMATLLLEARADLLRAEDTALLEALLRECRTWAHVDVLAGKVAGTLLLREPATEAAYRRWGADEDQWVRRSGLLAFLLGVRRPATFDRYFPAFTDVADPVLEDPRFFVRKAVGWVLREGAKHHPGVVARWLAPRVPRLSGVTLREAVRPLDATSREQLMAAYRARRRPG